MLLDVLDRLLVNLSVCIVRTDEEKDSSISFVGPSEEKPIAAVDADGPSFAINEFFYV